MRQFIHATPEDARRSGCQPGSTDPTTQGWPRVRAQGPWLELGRWHRAQHVWGVTGHRLQSQTELNPSLPLLMKLLHFSVYPSAEGANKGHCPESLEGSNEIMRDRGVCVRDQHTSLSSLQSLLSSGSSGLVHGRGIRQKDGHRSILVGTRT